MLNPIALAKDTVSAWVEDGGPQWSAAIAYYSVLSLAPLLLLVSTLAGLAFDGVPDAAFRRQLRLALGERGADLAMGVIQDSTNHNRELPSLIANFGRAWSWRDHRIRERPRGAEQDLGPALDPRRGLFAASCVSVSSPLP